MKKRVLFFLIPAMCSILILSACARESNEEITATGTLSAVEIDIAPEVSGKVMKVNFEEGEKIKAGDVLLTIDDALIKAQYDQARASVEAAAATLKAAESQLVYAQLQQDLAEQNARASNSQMSASFSNSGNLADFKPAWYFQKSEKIAAAQADVDAALKSLSDEKANLQKVLKDTGNVDFIACEQRLSQAQYAYENAQTTLDHAKAANNAMIDEIAQNNFDSAKSELDAAQLEYDKMLDSDSADAVSRARGRVAVAQARYDAAVDTLTSLQTGEESLQVSLAKAGVEQARAAREQAQANYDQAKAALALVQLQLERTSVKAPVAGTLVTRNVEVGDLIPAGGIVMSVADLETLNLVVYIPEDQYGRVTVGQAVEVKVDSFPEKVFVGHVSHIANEAEFTPRNVQTIESRASTVFAVKIVVPNSEGTLKPGMPADVTFLGITD